MCMYRTRHLVAVSSQLLDSLGSGFSKNPLYLFDCTLALPKNEPFEHVLSPLCG